MANHMGSEGVVRIGEDAVAEVRAWTVEETGDAVEDTRMGDAWRRYRAGLKSWSGSVECFWDPADADGQEALGVGAQVTLNLYPGGEASGDAYFSGAAVVTAVSRRAGFDGMVEAAFRFQGSGALARLTVA